MKYQIMVVAQIENKKTGLGKAVNDLIEYYCNNYGEDSVYRLDITNNLNFIKSCLKILFSSCEKFYFTPSGSLGGNIRDSIYLALMLLKRKKVITHFHNSSFKAIVESNFIIKAINKIIYNKVDKIILLGEKHKSMFSSLNIPNSKFRIVRNGIDEYLFISNELMMEKYSQDKINVVYFSNMIPDKGYQTVLSVAKEMNNDKSFHFYFSGIFLDPHLKEEFLKELEKLDNVTYINGVYGIDKSLLLSKMHFFILPSKYKYEALPISMLEAIANGVYIIVSDVGVINEVINKETTLLLRTIEPSIIINELKEKSKVLSSLNYNVEYYKLNFSNINVLKRLISIIEE